MRRVSWNDRAKNAQVRERSFSTQPTKFGRRISVTQEDVVHRKGNVGNNLFDFSGHILSTMQASLSREAHLRRVIRVGELSREHGEELYMQIKRTQSCTYSDHTMLEHKTPTCAMPRAIRTIASRFMAESGKNNGLSGSVQTCWEMGRPHHKLLLPGLCTFCTGGYFYFIWLSVTGCAEVQWTASTDGSEHTFKPHLGTVYLMHSLVGDKMAVVEHENCHSQICFIVLHQHTVTSCESCNSASPESPTGPNGSLVTTPIYAPSSPVDLF